jgi:hypothetical protein
LAVSAPAEPATPSANAQATAVEIFLMFMVVSLLD